MILFYFFPHENEYVQIENYKSNLAFRVTMVDHCVSCIDFGVCFMSDALPPSPVRVGTSTMGTLACDLLM